MYVLFCLQLGVLTDIGIGNDLGRHGDSLDGRGNCTNDGDDDSDASRGDGK